jgi:U3 small nucleolar RNA-associated protein 12
VWAAADDNNDLTGSRSGAGRAYVGANEDVLVWDLKKAENIGRWTVDDNHALVTVIHRSKTDPDIFAVGYDDGKIRIWDSRTATVIITFNGHRTAVTQLMFDHSGVRLASGSRDTDIIVWDLVAEVGLYRLRGHKDQITSLNFLYAGEDRDTTSESSPEFLLSTSKDALIKVWDLSTQHCIETHVTQTNGECWAMALMRDDTGCITAGNDGELKVWSINQGQLAQSTEGRGVLQDRGTLYRHGRDRPLAVILHPKRDLIAVHGSEKSIELFRIRSETEIKKALARKRKRRKEKDAMTDADSGVDVADDAEESSDLAQASAADIFFPYVVVRTGGRVRSIEWAGGSSTKSIRILIATSNNQLELFEVTPSEKKNKSSEPPEYNRTLTVDMPGHRTDIRCIALSSDDRMLATASQGSLKIWNTKTQSCLRTLECGHALCLSFLPGDKIVVVGTREGHLEIFDIAASLLLDTMTSAHDSDIWSLQVSPDGKLLVTGSADKSAKFWSFKVIQEEVLGTSRKTPKLTLVHTRTLQVSDDILSVCFSPDSRLIAVSTLDSTVKVFFLDTLKLFLTLYGHKLPVLAMDISYDSKLIATSSADKNVKIWGLDFGDCHKSFFAHNDSILGVKFIPHNNDGNGHHFFSCSKDRTVKYYDADKFEQIQKLDGHKGEIWAMAISHSGDFLVTASHDKSIRIWKQTDEQIFLEEEREKELEEMYENTLLTSLENDTNEFHGGETVNEVGEAGKQTTQTLMAGEKISEALELGIEDLDLMTTYHTTLRTNPTAKIAGPQRNPIFQANAQISAPIYVLQTFTRIPASHLQDALLVLSFSQIPSLFRFLGIWADQGLNIPLVCRILLFMLKTHQRQIVASGAMKTILEDVREKVRGRLERMKREMGFNLAGLRVLGRRVGEEMAERGFVDDGEVIEEMGNSKGSGRKREFVNVA